MNVLINPGSRLPEEPQGWTNTYAQAKKEAHEWWERMRRDGFGDDIELIDHEGPCKDGRWLFVFLHKVTRATKCLETHGIDDLDAYKKQAIFPPRVYWNGSSCSNPELADFTAHGYTQTFRKVDADD